MEVKVKVNIDVNAITATIESGINKAIKVLSPQLTAYAKTHHRYNDVSGSLSNSISTDQLNLGLRLKADELYGVFIHDGFKTWAPDPWLEETLNANEKLIVDTLNEYISKELK